jgi:hypothetical protein
MGTLARVPGSADGGVGDPFGRPPAGRIGGARSPRPFRLSREG